MFDPRFLDGRPNVAYEFLKKEFLTYIEAEKKALEEYQKALKHLDKMREALKDFEKYGLHK